MSGWHVIPDLVLADEENAFERMEKETDNFLKKKLRMITLGGDHSVTLPVIRAYAREYPKLNILHLDAHPDLYDELGGNRYSHACPFARIMEENLAERLVQAGIRTMTGMVAGKLLKELIAKIMGSTSQTNEALKAF
jgi:arginase family enzyme